MMAGMHWLTGLDTWQTVLVVIAILLALAVVSAVVTALLVRRGLHTPAGLRLINRGRDRVVKLVKRPITIMVLDEVADVIQTGHYTKNISAAIVENHDELKALAAEKIKQDPNVRIIGRLPLYDALVSEISETTLRVLIEMLGDPRMDELVSDLLRNNLEQIKIAVRQRQNEQVGTFEPPDRPVDLDR
jgi:hypothetical protein